MPTSHVHNFHLPLPADVYKQMKTEAKKSNETVTELVRQAIQSWLAQRKKSSLHREISQYASQHAGTPLDLDEALEASAAQDLFALEKKS